MLRVMQKMLSLQAAVPRPRYLSCLPHYSSTDRDARGRPPTNNSSKWKSNLLLGTAAAAVTFATLTRVPQAAAFNPIESLKHVVGSAEQKAEETKEEVKGRTREAAERAKQALGATTETAEEAAQSAKERGKHAAGKTAETAGEAAERAKEGLYEGKERAKYTAEEAAQRATEMGSYAKERVKGTAEETVERTREAKEAAKERAKEAADRWKGKLRSVLESVRHRVAPVDKVPPLPYHYDDLEPYIDTGPMQLHYNGHHQAYVRKLKEALRKAPELLDKDLNQLMQSVGTIGIWHPEVDQDENFHPAGHWNHSFWWRQLAPAGSKESSYEKSASPELKQAISDRFGSLDNLKQAFKDRAQQQFGSGWVWLAVDRSDYDVAPKDPEALVVVALPNQDNPLMDAVVEHPGTPILGLDNWEHAYYLKHGPKKADYVDDVFNVINWRQVSENYEHAKEGEAPPTT
ncbi:g6917 [Coccomyxa viridis]|uniref:superoxide dismutase n=1 Tax=Coccomyxa viridis TaxID=1274662 RepID=A0ABP1FWI5_9CHLO